MKRCIFLNFMRLTIYKAISNSNPDLDNHWSQSGVEFVAMKKMINHPKSTDDIKWL